VAATPTFGVAKSRIVVLLVAFVAWCCVPAGVPSQATSATAVTIAAGKAAGSKFCSDGAAFRGPIAPSSVRLKLHALRSLELTLGVSAVTVAPQIGALPALWLPDQRAAIRQGCPRFDRPDSAPRVG